MTFDSTYYQRELVNQLFKLLPPNEFKLKVSSSEFVRRTKERVDTISIEFISHPGIDFDATMNVDVRISSIEDICNSFKTGLSRTEIVNSSTVGGNLGNIMGRGQDRFTVANDVSMNFAVKAMCDAIYRDAFPYFERFADIREVLAVCSYDEPRVQYGPTTNCPSDGWRAMKAMAAAFLLGDKSVFDKLVARKVDFLQNRSGQRRQFAGHIADALRMAEVLTQRWDAEH